jgi:hypothetical protein
MKRIHLILIGIAVVTAMAGVYVVQAWGNGLLMSSGY